MTKNHKFDEIYKKYKNLVLKIACRYTDDLSAAEDIMQETFLALYKDMDQKEYSNIEAWLFTTAKHRALNHNKKVQKTYPDSEAVEKAAATDYIRESTEAEYLEERRDEERRHLHEKVFTGLLAKNPRWYEAIMLTCVWEMPQKEAAEKMGMTADNFYVMLHRARSWIKKKYGVEYDELNRL